MILPLFLCGVAAAEIVARPSICIDPPPQSSNSSLDAVVARELKTLAAPSISWQSFMRGATLADRAVSVVRVRDAPGPPVSTLIYLTTACTPCHLHYLRACWPTALRKSVLAEADVLTYAGCRGATSPSAWAHALAALPVRNVTLAWTRWNPGYQEGAMAAVMVAARQGWFDSYAWVVRANPDVRIEDASFLAARLRKPTVDAVLVRCRPRAPSICTDFFAARPEAFNHSAWGRSRKKNGRVNNVPTQRPGVRASTCSVDRWRRRSPVDGRRSSPRTTSSGPPSTAGVRRSGTWSGPTGRGAAAAAAWVDAGSITTTRCADGRGSVRKFCTGNKYLI